MTSQRRGPATRALATLAAAAATCLLQPLPLAQAAPHQESNLDAWEGASAARAEDELELDVVRAEPITAGQDLRLRVRIHNPTSQPVEDLQVNSRRGEQIRSAAAARTELATGSFPLYGKSTAAGTIAPGETKELELNLPTDQHQPSTLDLSEAGTYPLMFTLTGTREGEANSFSEERMLYDVLPDREQRPRESHDLTLIYPITADTHIVPGETGGEDLILANDELAGELAPGGRLDALLESYLSHDLHGAGCVALDPALVDTVDRMAAGYTVHPTRPSIAKRPQRLRDSWFSQDDNYRGEPGAGSEDAARWIKRLGELDCTVTMPWANADASAVARANNKWLNFEATERSAETISRLTGHEVASDLQIVGNGYVTQALSSPVLVADNTTWEGKAATFDATLGSLLAQSGPRPQTMAFSNPELRYDYELDSQASRALSAGAAISVAAREGDTVAKLPNYQGTDAAERALAAAERALEAKSATPRPIQDLEIREQEGGAEGASESGSPFSDPAEFHDSEVTRVEQQARYTDELTNLMVNDPAIALTRYGFTLPLRRDLLLALSLNERATRRGFNPAARESALRLDRHSNTLRDLRESVSLIPPGNVYTRVSESSPLLIVAENGLPLPVEAKLAYDTDSEAKLNTPETVRIPAKGSITVSMTADMPTGSERTDIRLWLANPDLRTISQPINIAVQTRAGIVSVYGLGIATGLALLLALVFKVGKQRKD